MTSHCSAGTAAAAWIRRRTPVRDKMIGAIVRRAIEHPEFREQLMSNPRAALEEHGFALGDEDFKALERVRAQAGGDPERVEAALLALAQRYGIDPEAAKAAERET